MMHDKALKLCYVVHQLGGTAKELVQIGLELGGRIKRDEI